MKVKKETVGVAPNVDEKRISGLPQARFLAVHRECVTFGPDLFMARSLGGRNYVVCASHHVASAEVVE